jgi:hypothetical protein
MMTEPKEKTLIQRGDFLFCTECDCAWAIGEDERHDTNCMWYVPPEPAMHDKAMQETLDRFQKLGEECKAFGPDLPFGKPPIPVVPIYGWICSKCQRVFAPHISECSHCQPGICGQGKGF